MNTTLATHAAPRSRSASTRPVPQRFLGVVASGQTYRNVGYLLLGLPLATIWFTVLVTGFSVSATMVVVALLGVPMLLAMWYLTRAFANIERGVSNALLGQEIPYAPLGTLQRGNPWVRLRSMSAERDRWRELGHLLLRLPVAAAMFATAVVALATPITVAYAPIHARAVDDPFGDWFLSSELEDVVAGSPWSWLLLPLGLAMLVASFHLTNALARAGGEWTASALTVRR